MIKYNLICRHDHEFEAWFSSSSDYDAQRKKRLVQCPHCGSAKVEKAIMAPNVSTSRKKEATASKRQEAMACLLYTSPSPRDLSTSRMPSSA